MSMLQEVICVVFLKCINTLGDIASALRIRSTSLNPIGMVLQLLKCLYLICTQFLSTDENE